MKIILRVLISAILFINIFSAYAADESYIMGDINTLPADFYLNVNIEGNAANIVDKLCTFKIERADNAMENSRYDISFFKQGSFVRMYQNQSLPFTMKRNYRGIKDGDYLLTFVAKDKNGKTGKGSITLKVRH